MPNKLTVAEIKKALDSYKTDIGCAKCGFKDKYLLAVLDNTLDLINRYEFKIQLLEKEVSEIQNANLVDFKATIGNYKEENKNLKAEVERLREIRDLCNTTILEKNEQIEKLKISDASKEECTIKQHGEIKELKADIERLKKDSKRLKKVQKQLDDLCIMHHIIKAEA
jgi:chromosome segregation ATPase